MELWDCNRAARTCIVRKANPTASVGITSAARRLFSLIRPAPPACLAGFALAGFPAARLLIWYRAARSNLAAATGLFLQVVTPVVVLTSVFDSACAAANPHENIRQMAVIIIRIASSAWLTGVNRQGRTAFHVAGQGLPASGAPAPSACRNNSRPRSSHQSRNNPKIAKPQRKMNERSERQTSTSFRFIVRADNAGLAAKAVLGGC